MENLLLTNDGNILIIKYTDNTIILLKLQDFSIIKKINNITSKAESIIYYTKLNETKEITPFLLMGFENGVIAEFNLKTQNFVEINNKYISQSISCLFYNKPYLFGLTQEQVFLKIKIDLQNEYLHSDGKLENTYTGYCQEILDIKKYNHPIAEVNGFFFTSNDCMIKYYNTKNNSIKIFEGHKDFVMSIDIKNDFLASSSKDASIRVWKILANNREINLNLVCILKGT